MKRLRSCAILAWVIIISALVSVSPSLAGPITFTHALSATGYSWDGEPVDLGEATGVNITFTATGDTDNRIYFSSPNFHAYYIEHDYATVSIAGIEYEIDLNSTPTMTSLTDPYGVVGASPSIRFSAVYPDPRTFQYFNGPANIDLRGEGGPGTFAWDMTTSLDPIFGIGALNNISTHALSTSGGDLTIQGAFFLYGFQADVEPVPEPSLLLLLITGLGTLGLGSFWFKGK